MKCCGSNEETKKTGELSDEEIKDLVRERYARVAQGSSCAIAQEGSCCSPTKATIPSGKGLAKAVGYSEDIEHMPESVTESFAGCGNPVALASLKKGEVVLDLGAGAGLDAFRTPLILGRSITSD